MSKKDDRNKLSIFEIKQGIHEIDAYLCNELASTDRKIEFYEKTNDIVNLSRNAGKIEMAAKILEKLRTMRLSLGTAGRLGDNAGIR